MRSFRFPRFAILLMLACFLTILAAIGLATEMARTVQATTYPGTPNLGAMWWARLPGAFAMLLVMLSVVGAVGYGIRHMLRRSGFYRLTKLETWPQHRQS